MDKKVMEFYNRDAPTYEETRFTTAAGKYIDSTHRKIVSSLHEPWREDFVLDVGCGLGRFSLSAAERGSEVVSLDFSNKMLQMLRTASQSVSLGQFICPVRMDARELAFRDEVFDGCICVNVIQLVDNFEDLIAEIGRVLKPGGFLILNFPNILGWYFPIGAYVNLTGKSAQKDVPSRWFSIMRIKRVLKNSNLVLHEVRGHMYVPAKTGANLLRLFTVLDKASRKSFLKYGSGSLFIAARKEEEP